MLLNTPHRLIWEMTQPSVAKLNLHLAESKHFSCALETELTNTSQRHLKGKSHKERYNPIEWYTSLKFYLGSSVCTCH